MASAVFWQRGEALDYLNSGSTTIEANTIVTYGSRIGVIGCDIAPGEVGSLHVAGVFRMPAFSRASGAVPCPRFLRSEMPGLLQRHAAAVHRPQKGQVQGLVPLKGLLDQRLQALKFRLVEVQRQLAPAQGLVYPVPPPRPVHRVGKGAALQIGFPLLGGHPAGDVPRPPQRLLVQIRLPLRLHRLNIGQQRLLPHGITPFGM